MSELTDEIVNKGLAEFMGSKYYKGVFIECITHKGSDDQYRPYTKSLDSLVPVWETTKYLPQFKRRTGKKGWVCFGVQSQFEDIIGKGDTIQQAAAYATYKAIKELSTKEKDE